MGRIADWMHGVNSALGADSTLSEAEKANHEFQESASALCDMLQTDLIHSYELVHRDVVKTVLSAILYKVAIRKAE